MSCVRSYTRERERVIEEDELKGFYINIYERIRVC